jgi:cytochrome c
MQRAIDHQDDYTMTERRFTMRKTLAVLGTIASLSLFSSTGWAVDQAAALELAKKSGCLACHSVDKKVVGPAWKDVGVKYKGNADGKKMLVEKVQKGGKGNWGDVPMPPYSPRVSDADIDTLVTFVLSLGEK